MAAILEKTLPWHEGEEIMHDLLHIPYTDNPTSLLLSHGAKYMLQRAPLLALGALDKEGRPWTTVWGGERDIVRPLNGSIVSCKAVVDRKNDPLVGALFIENHEEEVLRVAEEGKMLSGLAFDLDSRQRIKLYGKIVTGTLRAMNGRKDREEDFTSNGHVWLKMKIEQNLGNCPKYMNCKHIKSSSPKPRLISDSPQLPRRGIDLVAKADLFFISSSNHSSDMDTNIRGGPPGLVRILSNDPGGAVLVWPEYSGNRLYQTLGNLQTTPLAGLVFPDFESGDVLYVTGSTEILIDKQADFVLPRSNLAIKITLSAARFIESGLAFLGETGERSPYNPKVRYLRNEKAVPEKEMIDGKPVMAKLIMKEVLTPTIARFRFRVSDPVAAGKWKPGQYVTLSFEDELSVGYMHMQDDDPRSLNDDFIRTFTISSFPGKGIPDDEFEITVREVGKVTSHLFHSNESSNLEIPLTGFGGDFYFQGTGDELLIPFVASGIGITPAVAQLAGLEISKLRLFWTLNVKDIGLVHNIFRNFPELPEVTALFITGTDLKSRGIERLWLEQVLKSGAKVERRRLRGVDLDVPGATSWYICTGMALRTAILKWLAGRRVVYEDFNY